jgi:NhaP-type Na+/H+ or K+/H+ antiporter
MMGEFFGGATQAFVTAVLVAVITQAISNRFRMPPILFWLIAGMLLGPYGLHILHVEDLQPALHTLIELGLAIILFEGGLNLNLRALRKYGSVVTRLLVAGPLFTMLVGGWAVHEFTDLNWSMALLFGALVSVGGPTVILPIVRQIQLDKKLRHILTSEAMLIDAAGAILAIVMLQVVLAPSLRLEDTVTDLLFKFLIGGSVGWLGGWLLTRFLYSDWLSDPELRSIATLAATWGIFMLADSLSSQAGLLAVLVAGTTLQRTDLPDIQRLKFFKASLSVLLISLLFVLLAANLNLSLIASQLWPGLTVFLLLFLVARPLSAFVSSVGSNLSAPQILFLSCMAPRGVVAAAITSLFSWILEQQGHAGSDILQALVYIMIIVSVLVYGLLASTLSRKLGVDGANDRSLLIIGGGQMGAELGRIFAEDREVSFLDLNEEVVSKLQRAGYKAYQGNALDPIFLDIAHAEDASAIIVMTGSSDHNLLIAQLVHHEFHVREIYVALQEGDETKHIRMMKQLQAKRLFGKPYHFTYWNDQAYRKRLVYEVLLVEEDSGLVGLRLADTRIPHGVQPLAIMREGQFHIAHDDFQLAAGDNIWLLLRPERIQEGEHLILPPEPSEQAG